MYLLQPWDYNNLVKKKGKKKNSKQHNPGWAVCFLNSFDTDTKNVISSEIFPSCQHYPENLQLTLDTERTLWLLWILFLCLSSLIRVDGSRGMVRNIAFGNPPGYSTSFQVKYPFFFLLNFGLLFMLSSLFQHVHRHAGLNHYKKLYNSQFLSCIITCPSNFLRSLILHG